MPSTAQKFIFVTGGVCSGLGKGISAASIGLLLSKMGYKVFAQKLDPYLNYDPGTMNPVEHGEVFVTDDGAETDLDLGHYERFIDTPLTAKSSVSSGQIYNEIIEKERAGDYLGKTVQIIPHVTGAIKERVRSAAAESEADVIIVEIGGTVGDIEGEAFFEAVRQLDKEVGAENCLHVHLGYLPYLKASKELKSKPMQNSVRELRRIGIEPDILFLRADYHIEAKMREKVALYANLDVDSVIPAVTAKSIYEVPLGFERHSLSKTVCSKLGLKWSEPQLQRWREFVTKIKEAPDDLKIGLAGKYNGLEDSYYSVISSLNIAGAHADRKVDIVWIDTERLERDDEIGQKEWEKLSEVCGVVVPGGFGSRGIEGKIAIAHHCRKQGIPYLGLCLGSQIMSIELAREVIDPLATSEEFDSTAKVKIVHIMEEQKGITAKGGTMRLGSYPCDLAPGSRSRELYGSELVHERHRHRFEFNNAYREQLEKHGWRVAGTSQEGQLVEIVEIEGHPFMVGSQFHPEFLSRPERPHPLFSGFILAAIDFKA